MIEKSDESELDLCFNDECVLKVTHRSSVKFVRMLLVVFLFDKFLLTDVTVYGFAYSAAKNAVKMRNML